MATKLEIFNLALGLLGVDKLLALNDGSKADSVCSVFYDTVKINLLRSHNWNFAMKRALLSSSGTPAFEFKYQITKPNDCLRIAQFYDYQYEFKEEGQYILLNQASVKFKYVRNDVTESEFDPSFVVCLASKLAETICYQMTQSNPREQMLMTRHKEDIAIARRNNAISNSPDFFQDPTWLAVRL